MNNLLIIDNFYRESHDEMLAFLNSRLHNMPEAEDMLHDVFVRLLMVSQPIVAAALPGLAYTIARRLLIDHYRRHACRQDYAHYLCQTSGNHDTAESLLSVREITERVEHGLAWLPEACGEVYRLHVYGGMNVSHIAQALNENYKSVEYRLGLARKEVRKQLRNIV